MNLLSLSALPIGVTLDSENKHKGYRTFLSVLAENGDCKSSANFLEMIQKGRKSVQKHYFKAMLNKILGDSNINQPVYEGMVIYLFRYKL